MNEKWEHDVRVLSERVDALCERVRGLNVLLIGLSEELEGLRGGMKQSVTRVGEIAQLVRRASGR